MQTDPGISWRGGAARSLLVLLLASTIAACASAPPRRAAGGEGVKPHYKVGAPYRIAGRTYVPAVDAAYDAVGVASWYGDAFHGRQTANGERFDKNELTAAHKTLPLPTLVEVSNLDNGRTVVVRVNDRGPFVDDRIIDMSEAAARELGFHGDGLARVRVRYLADAPLSGASGAPRRPAQTVAENGRAPLTTPVVTKELAARSEPQTGEGAAPSGAADADLEAIITVASDQTTAMSGGYWIDLGGFDAFEDADVAFARAQDVVAEGDADVAIHADDAERYLLSAGPFRSERVAKQAIIRAKSAGFHAASLAHSGSAPSVSGF